MASEDRPRASPKYGELISDELAEARERKSSLERRGLAVITSSGTLVTALLAIAAFVTRRTDFQLSSAAAVQLTISAGLLLLASGAALFTNAPRGQDEISDKTLEDLVERRWSTGVDDSERVTAELRQKTLAAARVLNKQKAVVLLIAIGFEVAAMMFLAASVATILL